MLRELQQNTVKQFNKFRKTIQEKNVFINGKKKHNTESNINFGAEGYNY